MILHNKIRGVFKTLPLESMDIKWLAKLSNSTPEEIQPIIDQLLKDGLIKGKRKYKLKKVPKHVKDIP